MITAILTSFLCLVIMILVLAVGGIITNKLWLPPPGWVIRIKRSHPARFSVRIERDGLIVGSVIPTDVKLYGYFVARWRIYKAQRNEVRTKEWVYGE